MRWIRRKGSSAAAWLVLPAGLLLAACAASPLSGGGSGGSPPVSDPGGQVACTEIGCESGVRFASSRLGTLLGGARPLRVTACLDGDCVTVAVPRGRCAGPGSDLSARVGCSDGAVVLRLPGRDDLGRGVHTARLKLTAGAAAVLDETVEGLRFTANRPNGPDCPPVCWTAVARLS
jgi:hypothetical protein